jgi:tetratricopeptide (TPR) repeat protein
LSYYLSRQYDEAVIAYRQAIELDPMNPLLHDALAEVLLSGGQLLDAINEFKSGFECRGATDAVDQLTTALASGDREKTLQLVAKMKLGQLNLKREQGEYIPEIHFVRALAAAGETEAAINRFAKACEERNVFPLVLHADPLFSRFAEIPRVAEVLSRAGLQPTA